MVVGKAKNISGDTMNDIKWLIILQGIAAVFFGIAAVFWPGITLVTLVYLFSAFVLVWGVTEIIRGFASMHNQDTWWITLIFGIVGLGVGVYLVRHPGVSFTALILIIGLFLIGRGLLDLTGALVSGGSHRVLSAIIGVAAVIAGIILLFQPVSGGISFVWILGLYALVYGALTIAMAIGAGTASYGSEDAAVKGR